MSIDLSQFDGASYRDFRVQGVSGRYNWDTSGVAAMTPVTRTLWQRDFRARFAAALGGLGAWERPDLAPQIVATQECDGYRRETVVLTTRPKLRAMGYFLVPHDCDGARPTIVCLPGHGRGVDSIVGIPVSQTSAAHDAADDYQAKFALQCVSRGYPTFAMEPIGFGYRRDAVMPRGFPALTTCLPNSLTALMLGETLAGWRVWGAMRALDYLQTRGECVDSQRLMLMGLSGGGMLALFTAALDLRVAACVVSGYFNTFQASILSHEQCIDNYVPGLLNLCEMPDLAALIAPRALFVESGVRDPNFPVAAFEEAVARARDIYNVFKAPTHFGAQSFSGGHQFHGVGAFEFLSKLAPAQQLSPASGIKVL